MRLLRSFSFRLAAIYVLLFSVSLALVLGTYQLVSIAWPRAAVRAELKAESDALTAAYAGDRQALARQLEARAGAAATRAGFHLLTDPQDRVVSTNLPSWPAFSGTAWHSIEADIYRDGDEDDHEALVLDRRLEDGSRLMIGRDVEELDDLEEAIAAAGLYLAGATLVLATLGALLMNWAIGRRLATVAGAAREVMAGNLAGRVPLNGSGDEFDRLSATLNLMLDRVEAGVEAVRTASDSVAHELRTPLARLQASLRDLSSRTAGEPDEIGSALDEANRLQSLFDAILRISRIESGRHEASFAPVDLSQIVADAVELYEAAAEEKGLRLSQQVEPDLRLAGDRDLLFQAVTNLVDNAVKFTPAGGRVSVRLVRDSGTYLEVADTGPGVPEQLIGRMTERFFRAPSAAGAPGFGLGLALVGAVVRVHGGVLEFRALRSGLGVRMHFPAAV